MHQSKAEDFYEVYLMINQRMLLTDFVQYQLGPMSMVEQVHIMTPSSNTTGLEMHTVGYSSNKWEHLKRSYLGPEKVEELATFGVGVKGLSCGFDFRRKEEGNGACLRELILSRKKRSSSWTSLTVVWRTSEVTRKLLPDLILIEEIAKLIPNTDFQEFHLFFASMYQSSKIVVPFVEEPIGVPFKSLSMELPHAKEVIRSKETYYDPDQPPHRLKADVARMREIYKGRIHEPVNREELTL